LHPDRAPRTPEHRGNAALNDAAERIGNVIGVAMNKVREFPARARQAREQLREAQRRATGQIGETAGDLKRTARLRATQARDRTQQFVHEKPIHAIGGAAGTAFALGFALRLWRWKNARRG
jgi:ElaB/YqjD/DUF883 family membrane-anchored ribosome-binding protein